MPIQGYGVCQIYRQESPSKPTVIWIVRKLKLFPFILF